MSSARDAINLSHIRRLAIKATAEPTAFLELYKCLESIDHNGQWWVLTPNDEELAPLRDFLVDVDDARLDAELIEQGDLESVWKSARESLEELVAALG